MYMIDRLTDLNVTASNGSLWEGLCEVWDDTPITYSWKRDDGDLRATNLIWFVPNTTILSVRASFVEVPELLEIISKIKEILKTKLNVDLD